MKTIDLWLDFRSEEDMKNFFAWAAGQYPKLMKRQIKVSPPEAGSGGVAATAFIYGLQSDDVDTRFFFELALLGVDLEVAPDDYDAQGGAA
jgi:hypothetical protein